jgi:WD40 repeat protein
LVVGRRRIGADREHREGRSADFCGESQAQSGIAAFPAGGKYLASGGSFDATARIWEVATGQPLKKFTGHPSYVAQVGWSADGKKLIGEGGVSGGISVWTIASGQKTQKFSVGQYVLSLTVDPGRPIVTGVQTPSLSLWDSATGHLRHKLDGHASSISAFAWSPDGKAIVTASHDKTLRLYDTASGKLTHKLEKHTGPVLCVTWSPDGKEIVSGGQDKKLIVWDAKTGEDTSLTTSPLSHTVTFDPLGGPWRSASSL